MPLDLFAAVQKIAAVQSIQALCVRAPFDGLEAFDLGLRNALDPVFDWPDFGRALLHHVPRRTLMLTEGAFGLHYGMFRMPEEEDALCIVGPWTVEEKPGPEFSELVKLNFTDATLEAIAEYYGSIMTLPDDESIMALIYALLEAMDLKAPYMPDTKKEFLPLNFRPNQAAFEEPPFQEAIPAAMLEERYKQENAVLDAVARGDEVAALQAVRGVRRFDFNGRFRGSLVALKNKYVIINTLLRKTLERSQVHPYYINEISWRFAKRIEHMTMEEDDTLRKELIRGYCACVRRYSLKGYSPMVQRVINYINLNLASELSLKTLAALCYISPSYLSNLFKQETGATLTGYINNQRVRRAAYRLRTTDLGVAAVAEQVGFLDVNYFTKIFKKLLGSTPTQYRREHREG